jgi:hypothetical protein
MTKRTCILGGISIPGYTPLMKVDEIVQTAGLGSCGACVGITSAAVVASVLQAIKMALKAGFMGCPVIPRAALLVTIPEAVQVSMLGCHGHAGLIPGYGTVAQLCNDIDISERERLHHLP